MFLLLIESRPIWFILKVPKQTTWLSFATRENLNLDVHRGLIYKRLGELTLPKMPNSKNLSLKMRNNLSGI